MNKKQREEIIDYLVEDDHWVENQDATYFTSILIQGFVGYINMTDNQIIDEYFERCGTDNPLNIKRKEVIT